MQHLTPNKVIKIVRKRIDIDGLTKIPDQITSRMVQKERAHQQRIESLNEHIKGMRRFIYAVININHNQVKQKQTRKFFERQI
jgi:hypothetical protein